MQVMHKAPILESKQIEHVLNERRILEEASSHPFCVGLVRAYQDKPCLYLLQEWVGGQSCFPSQCLVVASQREPCVFLYNYHHTRTVSVTSLQPALADMVTCPPTPPPLSRPPPTKEYTPHFISVTQSHKSLTHIKAKIDLH